MGLPRVAEESERRWLWNIMMLFMNSLVDGALCVGILEDVVLVLVIEMWLDDRRAWDVTQRLSIARGR
jgi:hypothetical protein